MASKAYAFQQACRMRTCTRWQPSTGTRLDHCAVQGAQHASSCRGLLFGFQTTRNFASSHSNRRKSSCKPPRTTCCAHRTHHCGRSIGQRHASTSTNTGSGSGTPSGPSRRAISVTSDDGRYNWSELSTGEKAARGTQQMFNFLLVSLGLVGTITISYLLYTELFAPDSATVQFNAAVKRIKSSPECRELLGPASQIKAYGEPTTSKWARARPIAHSTETDRFGNTHFRMHFNVEGPDGTGVVSVHMIKPRDGDRLEYQLLSLTVKGHETIYLENREAERGVKGKVGKMFGVQWR
ncbi:Mitochondrial import inner membrane translocase subunit tim21 [Exophiala dermatitidis]|uniref:Mitochondrial import inner membrane translocase subunit Tim21 n=1 Tax=Exophiala dermatitidis (strain ATCC 34100 / CBS 525.76 / NIH/UT8656) TaxID=858893 RepID=H6CB09_EXODN|nr:uncharacterized protein HMPREF1120_08898 [Exophiala dermatitidis NIH/UT8656]EHY60956.1 hypothetical protein HMPREF1120_08898 [Exophiala dermatitidis NIH/UT8656]